jgi:hypothetical protein
MRRPEPGPRDTIRRILFNRQEAQMAGDVRRLQLGIAIATIAGALVLAPAEARITRIDITTTESPTAGGQSFGSAGQFERIAGKAFGELDPNDPKNAIITDIKLAPRNANGRVEYAMTFSLVKPIDMSKASGVLIYSVVNRGNGTATPNADGNVSMVAGWQGDVVPTANNQTMTLPVAKNPDGSSITGPMYQRWMNTSGSTVSIMIPRNQPSPYPPVSLDTTQAKLISVASETMTGVQSGVTTIPSTDWAFADCRSVPFPGTPDPNRVCLKNGFDSKLLYELTYTVKDPIVAGIGLAATRDISAFFRFEAADDAGHANPVAGKMKWGIIEGTSQSGTFVKLLIHLGFNLDEHDRKVWDGANPNIAARVTDLNRRFALPGGLVGLHELGHEGAVWYEPMADGPRGRLTSGILQRCRATSSCPKIMETFGATEIWGLRHSFVLVGTDARADLPLPPEVSRYYFASVNHGGGGGGFNLATAPVGGCLLPSNPAPTAPMRSALMAALIEYVKNGTPMPPSVYPKLAEGMLVANTSAAMGFPAIPGAPAPDGVQYPLIDYDAGPNFIYEDESGIPTKVPTPKQVLPQLVPKVDADGNELAGLKSPLLEAPLGTYLGWNLFPSGFQKGQNCIQGSPAGGYVPFAETKAARTAVGDPRPSLEERYGTHDAYVKKITDAANALVDQRYLLRADADAMIAQATASKILAGPSTAPTAAVVEYYWPQKDHYFVSQNAAEIAALDSGAIKGWTRTGQGFRAWLSGGSAGAGVPTCRYYGSPAAGIDSHFFSALPAECSALAAAPLNKSWTKESDNVFEVALPNTVTGACPAGTVPVYRAWNKRTDSNHRLTAEAGTLAQMVGKGYVAEGFGPTAVAMCAPAS